GKLGAGLRSAGRGAERRGRGGPPLDGYDRARHGERAGGGTRALRGRVRGSALFERRRTPTHLGGADPPPGRILVLDDAPDGLPDGAGPAGRDDLREEPRQAPHGVGYRRGLRRRGRDRRGGGGTQGGGGVPQDAREVSPTGGK